jgi:hypothetical protein
LQQNRGRDLVEIALAFQNDQIFRPSRIERKVCNCILGRHKIGIVQLCLEFLCIFCKNHTIPISSKVRWIHIQSLFEEEWAGNNLI